MVSAVENNGLALTMDRIVAGYNRQEIIHDATAVFPQGSATAIIGPNGAGKSTLFKAVFGIAKCFGGSMTVDNAAIKAGDVAAFYRLGLAYVPQVRNVFPSLTVRENLLLGTRHRSELARIDHVVELFPDLGRAMRTRGGELSGGQRNMLAVGRALMADPKYLLIDEASGGLSPLAAELLWEKLGTLRAEGVTIIAVEQNVHMALTFCERVYLMISGRMRPAEASAELMERVDLGTVFLEGESDSNDRLLQASSAQQTEG